MNKQELIDTYEKLKSELEAQLESTPNIKHMDSHKKGTTALEIFTFVIEDIKNLNEETVKREQKCLGCGRVDDVMSAGYCSTCDIKA